MRVSLIRLWLGALAIILFGHLSVGYVFCQTIDRTTQRNGMHVCPTGQFVVGVNVRDIILKCSTAFGSYEEGEEVVDRRTNDRRETLVQECTLVLKGWP